MPKKDVEKTKKKSSRFGKMMQNAARQEREEAQETNQTAPPMQGNLSEQGMPTDEIVGSLGNREAEELLNGIDVEDQEALMEVFLNDPRSEEGRSQNMDEQIHAIRQPEEAPEAQDAAQQQMHPLDQLNLIQRAQGAAEDTQFKPVREEYQTIGFLGKAARALGHVLFSPLTLVQTLWNSAKRGVRKARRAFVRWKNADEETENARQDAEEEGQAAPPQSEREKALSNVREGSNDQEILDWRTHRPMIWEEFIAEDPGMSPYITVDIKQDNEQSSNEMRGEIAHTSLALHYTRYDASTGERERCKVKFGFWPSSGTNFLGSTLIQAGRGALTTGQLRNDMSLPVAVGKRYGADNRQINKILLEAETYEAGGFNMLKRNCTTFVAELTQNAGIPTQDILQEKPMDLGAGWLVTSLVPVLAAAWESLSPDKMKKLTNKDDLSYGHDGRKLMSQEEYERFHEATDNLQPMRTHSPKAAAERIRRGGATLLHASGYSPKKKNEQSGQIESVTFFSDAMNLEKEVLYGKIRAVAGNGFEEEISQLDQKINDAIEKYLAAKEAISEQELLLKSKAKNRGPVDKKAVQVKCNVLHRQIVRELQELREYVSGWYYGVLGGDNRLMVPFLHLASIMELSENESNDAYTWQEGTNEERDVSPHLAAMAKDIPVLYQDFVWDNGAPSTESDIPNTKMRRETLNGMYLVTLARMYGSMKEGLSQENRYLSTTAKDAHDKVWFKRYAILSREYHPDALKALRGDFLRKGLTEEDVTFAFSTLPEAAKGISSTDVDFVEQYNGVNAYQALAYEKVFGGMANRVKELRQDFAPDSVELYERLSEYILDRAENNKEYFGMIIRGIQATLDGESSAETVFSDFIVNFFDVYVKPVLTMAAPEIMAEAANQEKLYLFFGALSSGKNAMGELIVIYHDQLKKLVADIIK